MTRPSFTAARVAEVRARLERQVSPQGRGDVAAALARDLRGRVPLFAHRSRTLVAYLTGRTRFFDRVVSTAVGQAGTVVVVGAGYDDRSVRFRTPGVRFVEVDHPVTQRDKRERLDRLGVDVSDVAFVPVDLECDALAEALTAAEVDGELPVTFVCEAVLPYLSPARVEATLAALARCCGRDRSERCLLAVDLPLRPANVAGRLALTVLRVMAAAAGEPVKTIIDTDGELAAMVARSGWREQSRTVGRDLDMPMAARDTVFLELTPT